MAFVTKEIIQCLKNIPLIIGSALDEEPSCTHKNKQRNMRLTQVEEYFLVKASSLFCRAEIISQLMLAEHLRSTLPR
uniref:Uncharacterized protein n=1 Tax=Sphaerodactylus townsendi TaxID=933632 RepID=A0ACB8G940_9SAUR